MALIFSNKIGVVRRFIDQSFVRFCRAGCLIFAVAGLTGCALNLFQQQPNLQNRALQTPAVQSAPTSLTEQAAHTLKLAETSVKEARQTHTLWSSAVQQLGRAQQAAKIFDSNATILHAQDVINICIRSTAQAKSPPVPW